MKSDRVFYSAAAAVNLTIVLIGFMPFYLRGHGHNERIIAPEIYSIVVVHGTAITAWYVLSLLQALLISVKKPRLHMKLGWLAVALVPVVAVSGAMVAIRSARASGAFDFFGMVYTDFLLVMLMEMIMFSVFVVLGLMNRRQPAFHRAMMLLASLSMVMGGAVRIPALVALLGGDHSRVAFFGPLFVLGALIIVGRWIMTRSFDRWFAQGFACLAIVYLGAEQLSRTDVWHHFSKGLLATVK
ncbi:MAG: hypothetical protein ABIZ04_20220 [Opitutus sp.]